MKCAGLKLFLHPKFLRLLPMFLLLFYTAVPAQVQSSAVKAKGEKALIVYLSRTGNTAAVARMIEKHTGGKLVALELVKPYPKDYKATVAQVARENETGYLPPLKTKVPDVGDYDVIFIGFPTWGMTLPPPMKSFLKQHNLAGKTIVPFNTNAGYGIGSCIEMIKSLAPKATIKPEFSIKGGVERDGVLLVIQGQKAVAVEKLVKEWIEKNDLR